MKNFVLILLMLSFITPVYAAITYVKPHITKNGTFVSGHFRTKPNKTKLDNFSYSTKSSSYSSQKKTKNLQKNYAQ